MVKIIYIENEIKEHPRTKAITNKLKKSKIIYVNRYSEVFNKRNQSFNLQKKNPAIILAKKHKNYLNKTPENYGIGNHYNYYFSYMYNCIFDCKYCFLQGLYSSANYVIFVNYEDFMNEMKTIAKNLVNKKITFFSGYDCDSLAYEPFSGFIENLMKSFSVISNAELEVRTKSTFIKPFLKKKIDNVIIAFSFTPERFSNYYEKGVPSVNKRIQALQTLSELGWKVGFRFDPIVVYEGWEEDYNKLFKSLFNNINNNQIHSVSFGNLRFPDNIYKRIIKNNPTEKLFFNVVKSKDGYETDNYKDVNEYCRKTLSKYIDKKKIFSNY